MKRYIQGEERSHVTLLPAYLDDYIAQDNTVRVVDVFVDALDLVALGFDDYTCRNGEAKLPPVGAFEALHLRLLEPHPIEPSPGARVPTQC